ncbi:MAG: DUF4142 domain-containing protein [Nitrospira sp.]
MKHLWMISSMAIPACLLVASCAFFQHNMPAITMSDANLIDVLDTINRNEIASAELARDRSSSAQVQAFADRVLKEHQESIESNRRVAQQMDVQPTSPSLAGKLKQDQMDAMNILRSKSDFDFDRTYIQQAIAKHVQALELVQTAAEYEYAAPLKQQMLHTKLDLLSHLSAAKAVERQLVEQ